MTVEAHRRLVQVVAGGHDDVSPLQWTCLSLVTGLGGFLRVSHLSIPMRYDEAYTVWRYASRGLRTVLADYSLPNNHIFHSLLVYLVGRPFGAWNPEVVRIPALFAGILMIPVAFAVFRRIAGVNAGLLAASLISGSPVLVDYSVNARGYTITGFLALIALGVAWALRHHPTDWKPTVGIGLVGAIGLWTVPVFAYVWGAVLLWVLAPRAVIDFKARIRTALIAGLTSAGVAVLLYTPAVINEGLENVLWNRFVRPDPFRVFLDRIPGFFEGIASMWSSNVPGPVLVLGLLGIVAAAVISPDLRWLALSLVVFVGGLLFIQHAVPYPRTWLVLFPVLVGLSGSGIALLVDQVPRTLWREMLGILCALGITTILAVSVMASTGSLSGEDRGLIDAENIVLELKDRLSATDTVLLAVPSTAPIKYYSFLHEIPEDVFKPGNAPEGDIFIVTSGDQTPQDIARSEGVELPKGLVLIREYPSGRLWVSSDRRSSASGGF